MQHEFAVQQGVPHGFGRGIGSGEPDVHVDINTIYFSAFHTVLVAVAVDFSGNIQETALPVGFFRHQIIFANIGRGVCIVQRDNVFQLDRVGLRPDEITGIYPASLVSFFVGSFFVGPSLV